jgi:hypothetical protein
MQSRLNSTSLAICKLYAQWNFLKTVGAQRKEQKRKALGFVRFFLFDVAGY